ncbi:hypothetical protein [Aquimarina intermedia]|uniref:Uncharacterized protein n=1 Tax=Aquimarina intermedia TaxID=350814 RepID=A0A5S5BUS3_9FLAO|nr:hypothetical protein [Aquimarina intermedia]TYP70921.1 hypothetical protein BD809_11189 [Aquimarina intermedia]
MRNLSSHTKLYKQAHDILHLSRQIALYLTPDFVALESDGSENPHVYYTGDIIKHSNGLYPEILKAENQPFQEDRVKSANALSKLIQRLTFACERLEKSSSNGRDFIILLRKEIKKFRRLQRNWMTTL